MYSLKSQTTVTTSIRKENDVSVKLVCGISLFQPNSATRGGGGGGGGESKEKNKRNKNCNGKSHGEG